MIILPKEERKTGLINRKFYPCPEKHVCVSTQSDKSDKIHYIEPIKYDSTMQKSLGKLKSILNSFKRVSLIKEEGNYLHYQFTTRFIRFNDDVEFFVDDQNKIIHFKSQSRVGGFDWNTNRNRMEKIRKLFAK